MTRKVTGKALNGALLEEVGLDHEVVHLAIEQTYNLLDKVDATLVAEGVFPLSQTVELANLSSMIGNIFASALANHSNGRFKRNGPHKYPDLLSADTKAYPDLELKMALERNKPKGHLAKPGYYITCRYVLCNTQGEPMFEKGNRGVTPYIWELRCGYLGEEHFAIRNTGGDSGKTAVVNKEGMIALKVVFLDIDRAPLSQKGKVFAEYVSLLEAGD